MLGSTLVARGVDHIRSQAAMDTTARMLRHMLLGESNVSVCAPLQPMLFLLSVLYCSHRCEDGLVQYEN